jgi:hypothetical protein
LHHGTAVVRQADADQRVDFGTRIARKKYGYTLWGKVSLYKTRGVLVKKSLLMLLLAVGIPAFGSQMFVCQSCSTPPGGDPNFITNPGLFDMGVAGGGNTTQTGILVIVGVYDGTSTTAAPTLTYDGTHFSPSGLGLWGETADKASLGVGQDAYVQLGFHEINGGHSESFSNWNLGEVKAGIAPATSFELFAYDIPTSIAGNSAIQLGIAGIDKGSFVLGFSCKSDVAAAVICPDGKIESTPFTNAGLIITTSTVPEPGTIMLLGSGLLGLLPVIRRMLA